MGLVGNTRRPCIGETAYHYFAQRRKPFWRAVFVHTSDSRLCTGEKEEKVSYRGKRHKAACPSSGKDEVSVTEPCDKRKPLYPDGKNKKQEQLEIRKQDAKARKTDPPKCVCDKMPRNQEGNRNSQQ